jgi:hypothetical protein
MFDTEKRFANSCRDYHNLYIESDDTLVNREKLYQFTKSFYSNHIGINLEKEMGSSIRDSLLDPGTPLIEVAHDGQIPHLGIVRMVLKTYHISTLLPNSLVLYFIGDHYSADMCKESTLFGIPQMGKSPVEQKRPVGFKIGRKNQHVPLKWIEPPTEEMINDVECEVNDWIINNISFEKKRGNFVQDKDIIKKNLQNIVAILKDSATEVRNYADWMIRVQYLLFKQLMGKEVNRILFLPFSNLYNLFGDEYQYILKQTKTINQIKRKVSNEQVSRQLIPYQKSKLEDLTTCFWIYCTKCNRRGRASKNDNNTIYFKCPFCGITVKGPLHELWDIAMPDIVGFEIGLFRLGISGWLVGSKAPYQEIIEKSYEELYGIPIPPRFLLDSIPVFRGVGESDEGYGRTTLLRALMEVSNEKLFNALMSPWDENPYIESDFLKLKSKHPA